VTQTQPSLTPSDQAREREIKAMIVNGKNCPRFTELTGWISPAPARNSKNERYALWRFFMAERWIVDDFRSPGDLSTAHERALGPLEE
jgi:hypothetical protein